MLKENFDFYQRHVWIIHCSCVRHSWLSKALGVWGFQRFSCWHAPFTSLPHLFTDVSLWQHFIKASSINNSHVSHISVSTLPPHPQPSSASASSPPARHWAWYYFLESAHVITPLSWHRGRVRGTTAQSLHTCSFPYRPPSLLKLYLCTH